MQQLSLIDAAVGERDQTDGKSIDAQPPSEGPVGEYRQLGVVAARQVLAHLAEHVLDDVEVVEQPLGVGRERLLPAGDGADLAMGLEKAAAIVVEAVQQRRSGGKSRGEARALGQVPGVLAQAVQTVSFGAEGLVTRREGESADEAGGSARGRCGGRHAYDPSRQWLAISRGVRRATAVPSVPRSPAVG